MYTRATQYVRLRPSLSSPRLTSCVWSAPSGAPTSSEQKFGISSRPHMPTSSGAFHTSDGASSSRTFAEMKTTARASLGGKPLERRAYGSYSRLGRRSLCLRGGIVRLSSALVKLPSVRSFMPPSLGQIKSTTSPPHNDPVTSSPLASTTTGSIRPTSARPFKRSWTISRAARARSTTSGSSSCSERQRWRTQTGSGSGNGSRRSKSWSRGMRDGDGRVFGGWSLGGST
jgi:hypothetical protein